MQVPNFDTVDELQQHVGVIMLHSNAYIEVMVATCHWSGHQRPRYREVEGKFSLVRRPICMLTITIVSSDTYRVWGKHDHASSTTQNQGDSLF